MVIRDPAGREMNGGATVIDYFARPVSKPGEVHTGLCGEPARELEHLFAELVELPG